MVKLGEVCEVNPVRPKIIRDDNEITSFIPMQSVSDKLHTISSIEERKFQEVKKGYTYIQENDVIFAKITPCMQNGKHAIATNLIGFAFGSTEFHVIRNSEHITPQWIHFYILQDSVINAAMRSFQGAVGQQRVPTDFLTNLTIPLPPLEMQKSIALELEKKLESVEKLKSALQEKLQAIEVMPQAYLREVFG